MKASAQRRRDTPDEGERISLTERSDVIAVQCWESDERLIALMERFRKGICSAAAAGPPSPPWRRQGAYRCSDRQSELFFFHTRHRRQLAEHLKENHCQFEVKLVVDWPQLRRAASPDELPGLAGWEREILVAVRDNPGGQIVVPANSTNEVIALLVRLYPKENILVIAKNREQRQRVAKLVREQTNRHVSSGRRIKWSTQPIVRIEPLSGAYNRLDQLVKWPVVIYADAESGTSQKALDLVPFLCRSVVYSVLPRHRQLDSEDRLRLELVCGPQLYRFSDRGLSKVTVMAVKLRRSRPLRISDPLLRRRKHIWHNKRRNQQVAAIARAFRDKDSEQLRSWGLPEDQIQDELKALPDQPSVAIVTSVPEQARALRKHLPEWRLRSGARFERSDLKGLPLQDDAAIVTRVRAAKNGLAADVVILADGTSTSWDDNLGPHTCFNNSQMLIVDLLDRFDSQARRFSRQRMNDYRERDWTVIDSLSTNSK